MAKHKNPPKATIDFETRSACDIGKGPWLYSLDPSTEVMCLAYKIADGETKLWHPAYPPLGIERSPDPVDLFDWIAAGGLVEAHNRFFEYSIWTHHMVRKFGWPDIPTQSWRCSAAKAAYYSLPRKLEGAVGALNLPIKKDLEGGKLMKRLSKPKKLLKRDRKALYDAGWTPEQVDSTVFWHESVADFERLWAYCVTDVDAEHGFSEFLPDLPDAELKIWQMDQKMNLRGVKVDLEMVETAIRLRDREVSGLNDELFDITSGAVEKASQRAIFKQWALDEGFELPDTQAKTLDEFLPTRGTLQKLFPELRVPEQLPAFLAKHGLTAAVHRAMWIVREVNRSSTAKYDAFWESTDHSDWSLRDILMYHGAGTGRWTGKGAQLHNLPRGSGLFKNMELAVEILKTGDATLIRALYADVMRFLSDCIRGAIVARDGKDLMVADYAAIEARVVFWLAGDDQALNVFREGKDIYMDMATGVYGYPVVDKKKQADERQFGKQGILGLGFEMGFVTFLLTCRKYDITFKESMVRKIVQGSDYARYQEQIEKYLRGDKRRVRRLEEADEDPSRVMHELILMKYTVDTYRERYPEVTQMWRDQEAAALQATLHPGRVVECKRGRNTWVVEDDFLKTYLPSGRALHYYDPRPMKKKTPWKNPDGSPVFKPAVTFMAQNPINKKWERTDTYGGSLVENITQATARDLMAGAMVRAEESGKYEVVLSVHDELICEVDEGTGDVKEFESMMAETPGWAHGCPVEAEGWCGKRYRK